MKLLVQDAPHPVRDALIARGNLPTDEIDVEEALLEWADYQIGDRAWARMFLIYWASMTTQAIARM